MAIRPEKFPEWARVPYIDPITGGSNVVEPPEQKKDDGWARKEKPPANYQNWLHYITDQWLKYLDTKTGILGNTLSGFLVEQDSGDPQHDLKFNKGSVRGENNLGTCILTSPLIKQTDVNWAEGNNQGGFPSGLTLTANTWYHCFAICKADNTTDCGFDSSITATNLLADAASAGYVDYKRVWSFKTEFATTNIRDMITTVDLSGRRITYWKSIFIDYKSFPVTINTPVLITLNSPKDIKVIAIFTAGADSQKEGNCFLYFSDPDQDNQIPADNNPNLNDNSPVSDLGHDIDDYYDYKRNYIRTNNNSQIRYYATHYGAGTYLVISSIGWEE